MRTARLLRVAMSALRSGACPRRAQQPKEPVPPIRTQAEIIQVGSIWKTERPPAIPEMLAEAQCSVIAGAVAIEHPDDSVGSGQEPEALGWEVCAARTDRRQPPAHSG